MESWIQSTANHPLAAALQIFDVQIEWKGRWTEVEENKHNWGGQWQSGVSRDTEGKEGNVAMFLEWGQNICVRTMKGIIQGSA